MNNKIKLAVAGSVLALSATANAGIVIPAGDWTLDVNGNVNAFATWTSADKTKGTAPVGGLAATEDVTGEGNTQDINTGLLPAWLGFTGTTRQNDVDVSFTISFQPNVSDNAVSGDTTQPLNRQAFVTFGDKSWGSVKLGKDLGIFAGDAILNDMTLLGVGVGQGSGGATTYGGIGSGYVYPAWRGQIAYTTPNMNGFQATIGITNPDQGQSGNNGYSQDRWGMEGKVSYSWTGDVAGKVWASAMSYDRQHISASSSVTADTVTYRDDSDTTTGWDIGASVTSGNLGLVAYYYDGDGAGTTTFGVNWCFQRHCDLKNVIQTVVTYKLHT
jgi:predicted porin